MGYVLHTSLYTRWIASSIQYGFPVGLAAAWKCKTRRASGHLFSITAKSTSLQMEGSGAPSQQGWPHSATASRLIPQKWILLPIVRRKVALWVPPPPSQALFLPKAIPNQPVQISKESTAIVPPLSNSSGALWWAFIFSVLKCTFPIIYNTLGVKWGIFSAHLFWDKENIPETLSLLWTGVSTHICCMFLLTAGMPRRYFCCCCFVPQ